MIRVESKLPQKGKGFESPGRGQDTQNRKALKPEWSQRVPQPSRIYQEEVSSVESIDTWTQYYWWSPR
jgi:hypothetical protein